MAERNAEEIFKEFKEHSIAEFFKKNRQMLGFSGQVRSLVTVVHEYVTNSLDACEEANILPDISVKIKEIGENRYTVTVKDNGPGIPKAYVGKSLATILAGTKFHRYVQQRGQQGIGAAGCTMFSQMTTGKPVIIKSGTGKGKAYSAKILIDTLRNKPIVNDLVDLEEAFRGTIIEGEFADVKYEMSERGVYEYLKRTALSNPHCQIMFVAPDGKENVFIRSVEKMPEKSKPTQPHPLGLSVNDLLEYAHSSQNSRKLSSFIVDTFARCTPNKIAELKEVDNAIDFDKDPKQLTWADAEQLIKAIKKIKWIAPDASSIIPIGEAQITKALKNILNPEFMSVVERKPKVFRGGVPFVVESAVAYGGSSGYISNGNEVSGSILRFANRVPLLFDAGNCAITEAVKSIEWKRYNIDLEAQPVSIFVNLSSVHVPYSGVGKEAVAKEEEIIEEIKLAVMDAARGVKDYIRGKEHVKFESGRYRTTMRYAKQLADDLHSLTGADQKRMEEKIEKLVAKHYPHLKKMAEEAEDEQNESDNAEGKTEKDEEESNQ
jgi:DNA topoisomerase-6 subunit B